MKKMLLWLTVLMMLTGVAMADTLPAPWTTGVYLGAGEVDEVIYLIYEYELNKPESTFSTFMMVYKLSAERAGYEVIELEDWHEGSAMGTQEDWYAVTDGEWLAYLCEEWNYFSTLCTVTLFVPLGMDFDPNPEKATAKPGTTFTFGDGTTYTFDNFDFTFQNPSFFH